LTTTVMNSVRESRAGIASGINNAVSRTAGLLAIAVLGLVMFYAFSNCIERRLAQMNIKPDIREALNNQRGKLAAADLPPQLDTVTKAAIREMVDECFVTGFRLVMLCGAGLAVAASLTAFLIIRAR